MPPDPVIARLTPLDRVGNYLIEAAGVSIRSRYASNRMAKALSMAGGAGKLEVWGPGATGEDILRYTVDITAHGRRQLTEGDDGFHWVPWTEMSLAPLRAAAEKLKRSLAERRRPASATPTPAEPKCRSKAEGFTKASGETAS